MIKQILKQFYNPLYKWRCCKCGEHRPYDRNFCAQCDHERCSNCKETAGW